MSTPAYNYVNTAVAGNVGNTGGLTSTGTSLQLVSTPVGYPGVFPFKLVIAAGGATEEIVKVTAGAGTSVSPWTIVRGQDGTTAQAQAQNASVIHEFTAGDMQLSRNHEAQGSSSPPHGLPASAWQTGNFAVISEQLLANSTTSAVTFSSISQSYRHLLLVVQARLNETGLQSDDITCVLNGDVTAVYSHLDIGATNISGSGTGALGAVADSTAFATTSWPICRVSASEAGASVNVGGGLAWIFNYTGTAFNKMFVGMSGAGDGSTAMVDGKLRWGWYNPASQVAVTSVSVSAPAGADFLTGSFFGLYGLGG